MTDLKAILFDLDDTLFDRQAMVDAFLESDRITLLELCRGIPLVKNVRIRRAQVFLDLLGLDEAYADAIAELYVAVYPRSNAPVDGAVMVVEALAPKFQLGIVSNGAPDVQYRKLETLGLRQWFECIVLSEELGVRKPDPRIFWHATGLLGREPEECLCVGDSYATDVAGAKKAGMQACWLNPGGLRPARVGVEFDCEIRTLDEVLAITKEVKDDV